MHPRADAPVLCGHLIRRVARSRRGWRTFRQERLVPTYPDCRRRPYQLNRGESCRHMFLKLEVENDVI
jgi:hypothetical protein